MRLGLTRLLSWPQLFLIFLVRAYRLLLSPSLGSSCRFEPSCSAYALQALGQHGALGGSYLTVRRLARCHPWCNGGHDPVPEERHPTTWAPCRTITSFFNKRSS